jgi:carbon-monoxide dehydrogenase large subunit
MSEQLFEVNGAYVSRLEDMRLITGAGRYASDWNLPGQLHAAFLRSDRAHAKIVSISTAPALAHPGVLGVYTGEDAVRAGYTRPYVGLNFAGKDGMKARIPERPALAHERVRFVGEALAVVVAESALVAHDAAELIEVEYEDLPAVIDMEAALAPGTAQLHETVPNNLPLEYEAGDKAATEAAFAKAAHVTKLKVASTRVVASPMEPRACVVAYEPAHERYTLHVCHQGMNMMKMQLATYSGLPQDSFCVEARDVGGGFGQRTPAYPEYLALMIAAKALGRPVKWISSRTEAFLSDAHGRANSIETELALDREGRFLAFRVNWLADVGAYPIHAAPASHIMNPKTCLNGVYDIPALYGYWRLALTNTSPVAPYRGSGRPDIAYAIERTVSQAAAELRIDPAELRRRNFIRTDAFPYKTPTGTTYDNADFSGLLEKALTLADWKGYPARRAASEKGGKLRGLGIATVIEATAAGLFATDEIEIEVDAEGMVTAYTVAHSQGQGHETTFAMLVAKELEIPIACVKIRQGASDRALVGNHTGGSRSTVGAGTVCRIAAEQLVRSGKALAAEEMGLEPSQVSYAAGAFSGVEPGQRMTLGALARKRRLSAKGEASISSTFPNGCHIAEVEIDRDTGVTNMLSYVAVDDCGVVVNHTIVEGQMHGAVAQGAGQVFGEHAVYDPENGQLVTASFSDYYMPHAGFLPEITMAEHPTASRVNPLGIKGMGESGCTASLGALVNAVDDALRPLGIERLDMPLTASKLWTAIAATRAAAGAKQKM